MRTSKCTCSQGMRKVQILCPLELVPEYCSKVSCSKRSPKARKLLGHRVPLTHRSFSSWPTRCHLKGLSCCCPHVSRPWFPGCWIYLPEGKAQAVTTTLLVSVHFLLGFLPGRDGVSLSQQRRCLLLSGEGWTGYRIKMLLILCDEYISKWVFIDWIMMYILYSELPLRTINCMFVWCSVYTCVGFQKSFIGPREHGAFTIAVISKIL